MTSYQFVVIDDSRFTRQLLKEILLKQGHKVAGELDQSTEIVQRCKELDADMIFLSMPASQDEGTGMLRELLAASLRAQIIICCSSAQQDAIMAAVRLGAAGYLLKPFNAEDVRECVDKHSEALDQQPAWGEQQHAHTEVEEDESTSVAETSIPETVLPQTGKPDPEPADHMAIRQPIRDIAAQEPLAHAADQAAAPVDRQLHIPVAVMTIQSEQQPRSLLHDIPLTVELGQPQSLAEAVHMNSGISFAHKEPTRSELKIATSPTSHSVESTSNVETEATAMTDTLTAVAERETATDVLQAANLDNEETEPMLHSVEESQQAMPETAVETPSPAAEPREEVSLQVQAEANHHTLNQEGTTMKEEQAVREDVLQTEQEQTEKEREAELGTMSAMLEQMQRMMAQMPVPVNTGTTERNELAANADTSLSDRLRASSEAEVQVRKRMTRTHMCSWNEDIDGETKQYMVVCTEGENRLDIEMGSLNEKQSLTFTLEGFFELVGWIEETIGARSSRS